MKACLLLFPLKKRSVLALLACCAFAASAFAGVEQTVNDLIPKLAAEKVEDRYAPQMELQSLAANASRPGAEAERAELAKSWRPRRQMQPCRNRPGYGLCASLNTSAPPNQSPH